MILCAKNYENWLAVDKFIAKIIRLTFLAHHCIIISSLVAVFRLSGKYPYCHYHDGHS